MKPKHFFLTAVAAIFFAAAFSALSVQAATITAGSLIKGTSFSSVYYYSSNGKRYVFPNEKTYKTWYSDFSGVVTIPDTQLSVIPIGGNVTYRPGVKMVKITTAPRVYTVAKGGVLRWVTQESIASAYYGADWNKKIDDIPDAFFTNYTEGAMISASADYNPITETTVATTIDVDKGISQPTVQPKTVDVTYTLTGFNPQAVTINKGDTIRWTNNTTGALELRSNPHPAHTDNPAFSGNAVSGGQYSQTFSLAVSFGYHNHVSPGNTGTITVNP
ncbi:hypothetical protein EPN90_03505 [Patescibacteria group bacterium]|nr:MAG: hypothetical protein EPN90_03505 [Patescibacteria group bacterium]